MSDVEYISALKNLNEALINGIEIERKINNQLKEQIRKLKSYKCPECGTEFRLWVKGEE